MKAIQKPVRLFLLVLAAGPLGWQTAPGAVPQGSSPVARETREFAVYVDNRSSGKYFLTTTTDADGRTAVSAQADVRVPHLLRTYVYSYRGSETWTGDRPVQVEANSNDDGKKMSVTALRRDDGSIITVNGQQRTGPGFFWTTTYWRLPPPNVRNQLLAILDVDSGKVVQGRLQLIQPIQLNLAGKQLNCSYYQLKSEVPAELWFDDQGRLVRQITVEDGHRTELKLVGVR